MQSNKYLSNLLLNSDFMAKKKAAVKKKGTAKGCGCC